MKTKAQKWGNSLAVRVPCGIAEETGLKPDNARSGLMRCCPITSKIKAYPFVVPILGSDGVGTQGWRGAFPLWSDWAPYLARVLDHLRHRLGPHQEFHLVAVNGRTCVGFH